MSRERHLLLVDDAVAVRRSLGRLLRRAGWRVTEAADGMEALAVLRTTHVDVLLTDVRMPRLDGVGLLRAIREELRLPLPAVVLSGYHDEPEPELQSLGVRAVVAKPADPDLLLSVCAGAIDDDPTG